MDGNRRFAQKNGKDAAWGHRMGTGAMESILHWTYLAKIKHITIYAFSTENFKRGRSEVESIFELLEQMLFKISNDEKILKKKINIRLIGETDMLPEKTIAAFKELEEKTSANDKMYLNVAAAYGGRNDIAQAFRKIAEKAVGDNGTDIENRECVNDFDITNDEISKYLFPYSDKIVPDVDFMIRTGEERRTSNFLPWQANGNNAVVYFYSKYWPEFTFKDLFYLLRKYQKIEEEIRVKELKRAEKINAFLERRK
ncbi:MAG: polyprenyl diphosphate synthase [Methanimicrococcus sp.]|nr:polyprenyl diphosphate synthase [Methanimicrococcus sp.]